MGFESYYETITKISQLFMMSPALIAAVIATESSWDTDAKSKYGIGLMQVSEAAFNQMKNIVNADWSYEDLIDPEKNILIGTAYLKWLLDQFEDESRDVQTILALMSYNWGIGNVKKWLESKEDNRVIDENVPAETKSYIMNVMFYMSKFAKRLKSTVR